VKVLSWWNWGAAGQWQLSAARRGRARRGLLVGARTGCQWAGPDRPAPAGVGTREPPGPRPSRNLTRKPRARAAQWHESRMATVQLEGGHKLEASPGLPA
jgi:hypothetical protein